MFRRAILTALAVLILGGAGIPTSLAQPLRVAIDGSSTVYPITEAVAEEFQKAKAGSINVTVGISGTGGGFKKFLRDETDICNASRPILQQEFDTAKKAGIEFIELPIAFDALSVVVNPENTWVDSLTTSELKLMWEPAAEKKITNWKQVRSTFPDAPLTLYGPGADSGTFDYFTEVIVGKAKASRGDYMPSEDDNVLVQGVTKDKNALGYFGFAYYLENKDKLKLVAIDAGKGPVKPSEETVMNGTYSPLSRPLFIYVNVKSLERPEVREFAEFYLNHVSKLAKEVGYIPLPADAYEKAKKRLAQRETGTAFLGHSEAGMHVDEMFARKLHR